MRKLIIFILFLGLVSFTHAAELYPGVRFLSHSATGTELFRISDNVTSTSGLYIQSNLIRPQSSNANLILSGATPTSGAGDVGGVTLQGGTGGTGGDPSGKGGDINLSPGSGTGAQPKGRIYLNGPLEVVIASGDSVILHGTATSTFWGDGSLTTIGGALNASGTITQSGIAVLTTSTNLSISNFATTSVGQWLNNSYATWNWACGGTDKVSSISATGTIVCTADQTGAGAQGTVVTSTAVTANNFPFWVSDGGLSGTSTLTVARWNLVFASSTPWDAAYASSSLITSALGTNAFNSTAFLTTSTGLGVSNFASADISQWTNDSVYIIDANVSSTYTAQGVSITTRNLTVASSGPLLSAVVSGDALTLTTITTSSILAGYFTPSQLAGTYLRVSGNTLTVSSTVVSSTINLQINSPTSTAPSYSPPKVWDYQRLFTQLRCFELNGTTTLEIYNTVSYSTTTVNSYLTRSLVCGVSGGTTTSFTSSTLLANYGLIVNVTSTSGSATNTLNVSFISQKQ